MWEGPEILWMEGGLAANWVTWDAKLLLKDLVLACKRMIKISKIGWVMDIWKIERFLSSCCPQDKEMSSGQVQSIQSVSHPACTQLSCKCIPWICNDFT